MKVNKIMFMYHPDDVAERAKKEIQELIDPTVGYHEEEPIPEEESTEEQVEEEEVEEEQTEEVSEEEEPTEEEEEEVEEEEEEEGEEKPEEEPEEEEDKSNQYLEEIARLTDELNKLQSTPKKEAVEATPEEDEVDKVLSLKDKEVDTNEQVYFKAEDFGEDLSEGTIEKFNKVLNLIVNKVREDSRALGLQDAMTVFPNMIDYKIKGVLAAKDFWSNNADILALTKENPNVKKVVVWKAQEIQKQHPEWGFEEIYNETEKEVRALLKLAKQKDAAQPKKAKKTGKPAFVEKQGRSRKPIARNLKKLSTTQAQIKDLMTLED